MQDLEHFSRISIFYNLSGLFMHSLFAMHKGQNQMHSFIKICDYPWENQRILHLHSAVHTSALAYVKCS